MNGTGVFSAGVSGCRNNELLGQQTWRRGPRCLPRPGLEPSEMRFWQRGRKLGSLEPAQCFCEPPDISQYIFLPLKLELGFVGDNQAKEWERVKKELLGEGERDWAVPGAGGTWDRSAAAVGSDPGARPPAVGGGPSSVPEQRESVKSFKQAGDKVQFAFLKVTQRLEPFCRKSLLAR